MDCIHAHSHHSNNLGSADIEPVPPRSSPVPVASPFQRVVVTHAFSPVPGTIPKRRSRNDSASSGARHHQRHLPVRARIMCILHLTPRPWHRRGINHWTAFRSAGERHHHDRVQLQIVMAPCSSVHSNGKWLVVTSVHGNPTIGPKHPWTPTDSSIKTGGGFARSARVTVQWRGTLG
jgi:hypothetical protein